MLPLSRQELPHQRRISRSEGRSYISDKGWLTEDQLALLDPVINWDTVTVDDKEHRL